MLTGGRGASCSVPGGVAEDGRGRRFTAPDEACSSVDSMYWKVVESSVVVGSGDGKSCGRPARRQRRPWPLLNRGRRLRRPVASLATT